MADLKKYEPTFCRQTKKIVIALQSYVVRPCGEQVTSRLRSKDISKDVDRQECLHLLHTLKGSAAMMECKGLENFAREAEELIKNNKPIEQLKPACQEIESLTRDFSRLKEYSS